MRCCAHRGVATVVVVCLFGTIAAGSWDLATTPVGKRTYCELGGGAMMMPMPVDATPAELAACARHCAMMRHLAQEGRMPAMPPVCHTALAHHGLTPLPVAGPPITLDRLVPTLFSITLPAARLLTLQPGIQPPIDHPPSAC